MSEGYKQKKIKSNSGSFKKGNIPWNKEKRKFIDLESLKRKYLSGESTYDLEKEFNVSQKTICNRLKEIGIIRNKSNALKICEKLKRTQFKKGHKPTLIVKEKLRKALTNNKNSVGIEPWNKGKQGLQESNKKGKTYEQMYGEDNSKKYKDKIKERRAKQIFPLKDSSIEVKLQKYLKQLGIEFYTHQYMKIEHGYQCDILIPKQNGINKKTIIECFGDYWHKFPLGREIDVQRCQELRKAGFRVLVFWENEIKVMELNDLRTKI